MVKYSELRQVFLTDNYDVRFITPIDRHIFDDDEVVIINVEFYFNDVLNVFIDIGYVI